MNKIALDTNILVYLFDSSNLRKRTISEDLVTSNPLVSVQVVSEFINVVKRISKKDKQSVFSECRQILSTCQIDAFNHHTMQYAEFLILRYDFQLFDSIIIASALHANCDILYSEDFQHNQMIEKRLTIVNPFL